MIKERVTEINQYLSIRSNSVQNIGPMRAPPPLQNGNGGPAAPLDQGFYQNVGGRCLARQERGPYLKIYCLKYLKT